MQMTRHSLTHLDSLSLNHHCCSHGLESNVYDLPVCDLDFLRVVTYSKCLQLLRVKLPFACMSLLNWNVISTAVFTRSESFVWKQKVKYGKARVQRRVCNWNMSLRWINMTFISPQEEELKHLHSNMSHLKNQLHPLRQITHHLKPLIPKLDPD